MCVSSLLDSHLRKCTQCARYWKSTKQAVQSQDPVTLLPIRSPGHHFEQLCLFDRKHVHHCLQMFVDLLTLVGWVELRRPLTWIFSHHIS